MAAAAAPEQLRRKLDSGAGVVAKLEPASQDQRDRLVDALAKGSADKRGGVQCFESHPVVIVRNGSDIMGAVVCFECHYLVVFDGRRHATTGLCDLTGLEQEWHAALARAGAITPAPPP